jgi:hypothetical protein
VNCVIDSSIGASLPQEYDPDALAAELTALTFLILQFRWSESWKKAKLRCDLESQELLLEGGNDGSPIGAAA